MDYSIEFKKDEHLFELAINGLTATLTFKPHGNTMVFTHVRVPEELEGKGVASALTKFALDYAVSKKIKVVPLCPFVKKYIKEHAEYSKIVEGEAFEENNFDDFF